MKVLHVISGLSRTGGGPARSSQGLVAAQCAAGVDAWLWPLGGGEPWVAGVRKAPADPDLLSYDLVHLHGIWDPRLHRVAVACRRAGVPYVLAPRGMLEPWSLRQKWLKKRLARFLYQDRDLRGAAALHATAESEAEQFRRLGFVNPTFVSPNGVNLPEGEGQSRDQGQEPALATFLFVSRMHPKKGVLELVEALARHRDSTWRCELVYTTSSDDERDYERKVKSRVAALGLEARFVFTGALDDVRKWEAYRRADVFVLPTYSENFGIVVAEALWAGVPVITTKGTPWGDLAEFGCGWWIDLPAAEHGEWPALGDALKDAFSLSIAARREMGVKGRRLVESKYTWQAALKPMLAAYERITRKER